MTAARYRKKPVEIDAAQWDGTADGATSIIDWVLNGGATAIYACSNPDRCATNDGDTPHSIEIRTLEGTMRADLDDWIIRGVQGEFYPCKPGIFAETYEPADGTASADQRAEAASQLGTRYMVRAEQAEATIKRAREVEEHWRMSFLGSGEAAGAHALAMVRAALDEQPRPAAAAATEPVGFAAIDAFIRLEGPKITVADDEISIEGLRIEKPARLTIHAGQRRLKLMHNALYDFSAINVCRDEMCTCHATSEQDISRVTALYEQWVKAGPPPLGALMSRWWDARLAELHAALLPPTDHTTE